MELLDKFTDEETVFTGIFTDEDSNTLEVKVTREGIILDAWHGDTHVGTVGRMADEWFQYVEGSGA